MSIATVAIHPDRVGEESYSDKWAGFLQNRGVQVRWVDLMKPNALDQVRDCHGVMWRWTHNPQHKQVAPRTLYTIERYLNVPVFPNHDTAWHYDEKVAQYYLLKALVVPMPQTWIFWDLESALEWAQHTDYPKVFKLSPGASSSTVVKIPSEDEATHLIYRMFGRGVFPHTMSESRPVVAALTLTRLRRLLSRSKQTLLFGLTGLYPPLPAPWWRPEKGYAYFQELVPGNEFDTRITVIGERAFGYRRMNRPGDFRASASGEFVVDPKPIDIRCVRIAQDTSRKAGFQSMAYDFIIRNGEPLITEISYTFVDWMVHACPGHWNGNLDWVDGQMWPEEAQVEDFLREIRASSTR